MTITLRALVVFLCMAFNASNASAGDLGRARAALSSGKPFVLIAVSQNFLDPDHMVEPSDGENETQADWAHYLDQWAETAPRNLPIIIISFTEYRSLIASPGHGDQCLTMFVRANRTALYYRDYCVPVPYEEGRAWLTGKSLSAAQRKYLHEVKLTLARARRPRSSRTARSPE